MVSENLVILGASGFLGRNILRALESWGGGQVKGIAVSRKPSEAAAQIPTDARWIAEGEWRIELEKAVARGDRAALLHCAALTDQSYCEAHPAEAHSVNTEDVAKAAQICKDLDVPMVYVCTDGLFGNAESTTAPRYWSLQDPPFPINAYATSKLGAEGALADLGWGHSIRMSFVGPGLGTGRGLISFLARRLRTPSADVPGFLDNWFSPAPVQMAAHRLVSLVFGGAEGHGIHQWGSHPALTKYDYLESVALAAGFHPNMIAVKRSEQPGSGLIPLDQSLSCEAPWSRMELIRLGVQALREELELNA